MAKLEDLQRGASVKGALPDCLVTAPTVATSRSLVAAIRLLSKLLPSSLPAGTAANAASMETRKGMERLAMQMAMEAERLLGNQPRDVSGEKCGYDIESRVQAGGRLRFIEVSGRVADAITVTVTRNEILAALNKPDDFILAVGQVQGGQQKPTYIRQPFQVETEFEIESINYELAELLSRGHAPA